MADDIKGLLIQVSATTELLRSNLMAAERQLDGFASAAENSGRRVDQSFKRVTVSSGQMRAGFQQLGFQINDIATGFATGQRPMQIFAQQGSQVVQALSLMTASSKGLLGFLGGPWGAVLTAATVVLTPFIVKLFDTGDAAKDAEPKVRSLTDAIKELNNIKISPATDVFTQLSKAEVELRRIDAQIADTPGTRAGAQQRLQLQRQREAAQKVVDQAKDALELRQRLDEVQARTEKTYGKDSKTKPAQIKEDADLAIRSVGTLANELANLDFRALGKEAGGKSYRELFGNAVDTEAYQDRVKQIDDLANYQYDANTRISNDLYEKMDDRVRSLADFYEQAFTGGTKRIGELLKSTLLHAVAQGLANLTVGGQGGFGGGFLAGLGSLFGGFFAEGGSPPIGKVSVVGENGPELFVPRISGNVVPNHSLGGTSVSLVVNAPGANDQTVVLIRRELANAAPLIVSAATQATAKTMTRRRLNA